MGSLFSLTDYGYEVLYGYKGLSLYVRVQNRWLSGFCFSISGLNRSGVGFRSSVVRV